MTPEAALHVEKAKTLAETATRLLHDGYVNEAARGAYLAVYHAAQAYIVDHTGRAAKTHSGTHTQFAQLVRLEPAIDEDLANFLPRAAMLKAVADYECGPDSVIKSTVAAAAIETAARFIEVIRKLLQQ